MVYNPVKVDLDRLRATVTEAEQRYGFAASRWLETSEDDPGVSMATSAVDDGASVVLAAGGDGTVRAVAQGLVGTGVALAVLPHGTGNLLARNLGLPLDDLAAAVRIAFDGATREIDAGVATLLRHGHDSGDEVDDVAGQRIEAEDHVFTVMAGMGLDAQMIVNQDEDLKKKAGWLAYVKSIGTSLKGGRRIKLRLTVDDQSPRVFHVHTLLIGNCGDLPANIVLLPDAEIDDGMLDLVALRPDGPIGWVTIWTKVLVEHAILRRSEVGRKLVGDRHGRAKHIRALRYLRGRQLRVQLRDPEEFELDGDAFGEVVSFTIRVEPGALSVRVPG